MRDSILALSRHGAVPACAHRIDHQGDEVTRMRHLVTLFLKAPGRIRTGDLRVTNAYALYDIFLVCSLY